MNVRVAWAAIAVLILVGACAKAPVVVDKPQPVPVSTSIVKPKVTKTPIKLPIAVSKRAQHSHTVEKGDTQWGLAARPEYYGDPFQWPNIHKANRDQIMDPDLIEVGWELKIPKKLTFREETKAREISEARGED